MPTNLKRMTFTVTPEMEPLMDEAKKMFYDSSQSEMIRTLVTAGLNYLKKSEDQESQPNKTA